MRLGRPQEKEKNGCLRRCGLRWALKYPMSLLRERCRVQLGEGRGPTCEGQSRSKKAQCISVASPKRKKISVVLVFRAVLVFSIVTICRTSWVLNLCLSAVTTTCRLHARQNRRVPCLQPKLHTSQSTVNLFFSLFTIIPADAKMFHTFDILYEYWIFFSSFFPMELA